MKIILQSTTNFPPHFQLNSSNFSISSLSSPFSHRKLKLFPQNTRLAVSTRYSRKWPRNLKIDEQSAGYYPQTSSAYISHIELICPDEKISKVSSDVKRSVTEIAKMDEEQISRLCDLGPTPIFELSVHSGLKFALIFGLISFHGSGQALASGMQSLASSDFAGGIQPFTGDLGDISTGFASAFLLIFFSELGDKTFFIAALLAARNSWAIIFIGTFGALAAMTIISVLLGRTFHYIDDILPFRFGDTDLPIDDIAAVCLLVYFGVSSLLEASSSDGLKVEEEQKEAELAVSEFSGNGAGIVAAASSVISTFLLVFVAEWGDKSFFSTIALAAAGSPLGVIGGALAGHAAATLLAVLGGSLLGTFLSEKAIAYVGGSLFLIFAAVTLIEIVS